MLLTVTGRKNKRLKEVESGMQKENKGFTLGEMIIIVSIFAILLGILVPSLNSIIGFRVQRATNSITSALDKTKIEASSRLVGEMRLEKRSDGYYISYILDRGKVNGKENIKWNEDEEKIAPAKTRIAYKVEGNEEMEMKVGDSLIITYDRATGAFLPLQNQNKTYWENMDIFGTLKSGGSIFTNGKYCDQIIVSGGGRKRTINFYTETGKYDIQAG